MEERYKQSTYIGSEKKKIDTKENRMKKEYCLWKLTLDSLVEIY
jgi:hypothetical protein